MSMVKIGDVLVEPESVWLVTTDPDGGGVFMHFRNDSRAAAQVALLVRGTTLDEVQSLLTGCPG